MVYRNQKDRQNYSKTNLKDPCASSMYKKGQYPSTEITDSILVVKMKQEKKKTKKKLKW